ncbi:hypothetical protein L6164_022658 [Bauhinia variegata]|uniref:Uncharacterized protein n=1 Tax=Bauhinia variegata TaxID=167791 RepID=A0ACB9MG29_BAUVA|nr:hypothetical protein L6164_022658 [Bauhinia variegata]
MSNRREIHDTEMGKGLSTYTNNNSSSNSNNPYVYISPVSASSATTNSPKSSISSAFNQCSKRIGEATRKAENVADNFWNHLRVSSNPADAAMARIVQGTKMITKGGPDKLFQHTFGILAGEKLLRPCVCYISTPSGPVIGTLYVSTKRLAFCSDHPMSHHPSPVQNHSTYNKVELPLDRLSTVNPYTNRFNPSEKNIQVVTVDGYEFYFVGFISYEKALKTIKEALQLCTNRSNGH